MRLSTLGACAALVLGTAADLPTISANGQYFFTSNGDRWFVKGIAYQLSSTDPLLDNTQCQADAALMQTLGANAIRVYHVEVGSSYDHSACMSTFANAGIYLFVDLDTFDTYINQTQPEWTTYQETRYQAVMDDFQQYSNTAGFFIGNEVLTDPTLSECAVYVKAATRDMKAYRDSKGYRNIPIGYSHADISQLRPTFQNYLACGSNTSESIDFFGLNTYEWCGSNTFDGSGYEVLTQQIMDYPIPIFMSETGCNNPEPRLFQDQTAIFSSQMTPYWSGAIIYEWIQEENAYGLITYGDDTNAFDTSIAPSAVTRTGTPKPMTPDFANLMSVWATVSPSGVASSAYTPSNNPPACPTYTASLWEVDGNVALPSLNEVYDSALQYSITAGHLEGQAASATPTTSGGVSPNAAGTTTASSSTATHTGAASRSYSSGDKELLGMVLGLGGVMLGFVWWL